MKSGTQVVSEGVFILNDEGSICLTSPGANQLFGYPKNELLHVAFEKLVPGWQLNKPKHQPTTLAHNGSSEGTGAELSAIKKSGRKFSVEVDLEDLKTESESFKVVSVTRLQPPSEIASKRIDSPRLIVLILDKLTNVSFINTYGCQVLGSAAEYLKGLNWVDNFLPSGYAGSVSTAFEQATKVGITEYESPVLTLKGERYNILWTTSVIYDSAGLPIGTLSTGVDSGKKMDKEIDFNHLSRIEKLNEHLELKVKNQNQELINSLNSFKAINQDLQLQIKKRKETEQKLIKIQRLYDTVVHNFPDGVIGVLNRSMEYILIDGKDLNEIDLPALGLVGQKVPGTFDSAQTEDTLAKIKKAFAGESVSFEAQANNRFYNISAVPLADEHNNINEILCVLKNVTSRKLMEDGLVKMLGQEKELGELRSRFVTMACHEFKTPLATILSSNFLLENYGGENFQENKLIHTNRIKRSVNNLTMILNEFLSLEKLDENLVAVVNSTLNIPNYIQALITEVEPLKQKDQVIDYLHLGNRQSASLDPHLLWSIITNLIANALKYSKEGDKISLTSVIKDNATVITVSDCGIGIPESEQKHIFDLFYRAHNVSNLKGTGLGLHIVEKNVKLLNGTITFTSQLNVGTEFTVTLPTEP